MWALIYSIPGEMLELQLWHKNNNQHSVDGKLINIIIFGVIKRKIMIIATKSLIKATSVDGELNLRWFVSTFPRLEE